MKTTANFQFVPAYYEWHLVDGQGNTVHNMTDPVEALFDEGGEPLTLEGVTDMCAYDLLCAEASYQDGKEYNGVFLDEGFTPLQVKSLSGIMAKALYNYYLA